MSLCVCSPYLLTILQTGETQCGCPRARPAQEKSLPLVSCACVCCVVFVKPTVVCLSSSERRLYSWGKFRLNSPRAHAMHSHTQKLLSKSENREARIVRLSAQPTGTRRTKQPRQFVEVRVCNRTKIRMTTDRTALIAREKRRDQVLCWRCVHALWRG